MHLFNMITVFFVVALVAVEFSVSAFVSPAAWRLDPEPQLNLLSRLAGDARLRCGGLISESTAIVD